MSHKLTLNNKRQLKPNEIIREGDVYTCYGIIPVMRVLAGFGKTASHYGTRYKFYRRLHTAKKVPSFYGYHRTTKAKTVEPIKKPNVTIVNFNYSGKNRVVQVISFNEKYLTGLEIIYDNFDDVKVSYQFKRFLVERIESNVTLIHYGPALMN